MNAFLVPVTWLLSLSVALAQTAPLPTAVPQSTTAPAETNPADDLNFNEFGDADDRKVKLFATQKVLFLSPTKLISVGYEAQTRFDLVSVGSHNLPTSSLTPVNTLTRPVNRFGGLRLGVNAPVISRSNFILNLGLTYWNTAVGLASAEQSVLFRELSRGLRSTGVNATVFKPLDLTHFLLVQGNVDVNGTYRQFSEVSNKAVTYSGTAIYGWKRDDNFMWGLGVTRTYRAGQVLHIPVLFYNRTFNPRWGVEVIFPARANLRRSFGTSGLLMLGYEIEGNAYFLGTMPAGQDLFLRRGELKPRITYERKLAGFVWLSAQAGLRYNWRFNAFGTQNPVANETALFTNTMGTAPYVNVSINLVSP